MMKQLGTILIIISAFYLSSCFTSNRTDNIKRNEVLGSWQISKESTLQQNNRTIFTGDRIITEFKLKADSTVTIYFGKEVQEGKWIWDKDVLLAKVSSDVAITYRAGDVVLISKDKDGKTSELGLNLESRNGKISFKSLGGSSDLDDFTYEKQ